ncbi:MAG: transketolase-like TK C-terminal-containing protein, partial [Spirochaetota bacterium]
AGHLGLNKLILLYDYNSITIDGPTDISYSDNPSQRFDSYNWHTQEIDIRNGDYTQFKKAIENAKNEVNKPSIIVMKTIAGKGLVNYEGSHKSHGNPMNESDVIESKNKLNINESFFIPDKVKEYFNKKQEDFKNAYESWEVMFDDWKIKNPALAKEFELCLEMRLDISENKIFENEQDKPLATRALSGKVINAISDKVPFLVGGSADLAGSTKTTIENSDFISRNNFNARNIHFGVREHAMGGILNGIALHKGLRPYGGTFLVFSDYMRPAIRLASLMKLPVIYIFTHDSFQVGEDGPTHQPIEQISSLRDIPNLTVIRPADAIETEESWKYILKQKENPAALILTRQKVKPINRKKYIDDIKNIQKGAYIIKDCKGEPDLILIACGSELPLAIEVSDEIENKYEKKLRVISMISQEIFDSQMDSYKEQVLPPNIRSRVAIESGITDSWKKYVGIDGLAIGINRFGESAPATDLVDYFGFTKAKVIEKISIFFGFK